MNSSFLPSKMLIYRVPHTQAWPKKVDGVYTKTTEVFAVVCSLECESLF